MIKVLILIGMIFCHIIDDYNLQGILASMKQKQWWKNNYPDDLYKYDYIVALFMHSFSWSFMIMILPVIYNWLELKPYILIIFIINLLLHGIIDHLKANIKIINLVQDQYLHLVQILATWVSMVLI